MAYLVKPALDDVFIEKDRQMLILLPFLAIAVALVKSLAAYGHEYLLSYVGQNILRRLKNRLYNHMQELPLSFFQKERTGDLMARITSDVGIVSTMFTTAITGSIRDSFTVIGLVFVIFFLIPQLAIFCVPRASNCFFPHHSFRTQDPEGQKRCPGGRGRYEFISCMKPWPAIKLLRPLAWKLMRKSGFLKKRVKFSDWN